MVTHMEDEQHDVMIEGHSHIHDVEVLNMEGKMLLYKLKSREQKYVEHLQRYP